jgi:CelD/BcsL family acetyltransferase involved in cellulose biosynthesis
MTSFATRLYSPEVTTPSLAPKLSRCIDPLTDPRWEEFLQEHPRASMFHSRAWLNALRRTYSFPTIAFTTSPAGRKLENAIVFCRVESWITGRRLVSLPFSDHCEPLVDTREDREILSSAVEREFERERARYFEIRPVSPVGLTTALQHTQVPYAFHVLDLSPSLDAIFAGFHHSSTKRKIRRAEREGLVYREGSTPELLSDFYRLFTVSRQRQGLAPQSRGWFANLSECFGNALKVRVALRGGQCIAAMITMRYKDTLTYKYGCSDVRYNNLGPMHLLFWNAIQEAKVSGMRYFDFGRCDADQDGLITFKNRWGARQSKLIYSRYGVAEKSTHLFDLYSSQWKSRVTKQALKRFPQPLLPIIGQIVYRHIG